MHAQLNADSRHSGQSLLASMHKLHIHFGSPARATRSVAETCNARARGAQASGLGPCTLAGMRNVHMLPYIKISMQTCHIYAIEILGVKETRPTSTSRLCRPTAKPVRASHVKSARSLSSRLHLPSSTKIDAQHAPHMHPGSTSSLAERMRNIAI